MRVCSQTAGVVITVLTLTVGCGQRSDRLAVAGRVTLDGVPLDAGSIRFTSTGQGPLASAGAMIKEGDYLIPREKGLAPGVYRLEISAPDSKAPPIMVQGSPVAPERIPSEYNIGSEMTVTVTDDGENEFDFVIVSAGEKKQ